MRNLFVVLFVFAVSSVEAREDIHIQMKKPIGEVTIYVKGDLAKELFNTFLKGQKEDTFMPDMGDSSTPMATTTRTKADISCEHSQFSNKREEYRCGISAPNILVEPNAKYLTLKFPCQPSEQAVELTRADPIAKLNEKELEIAGRENFSAKASSTVTISGISFTGDFAQTIYEENFKLVADSFSHENAWNAKISDREQSKIQCRKTTVKYTGEATRTVFGCYLTDVDDVLVSGFADTLTSKAPD